MALEESVFLTLSCEFDT